MSKAKTTTPENILLGYGVVEIDGLPIGLTRGGSSFKVERTVRTIEADGDKGPVKGRIVVDSETAKLLVKSLETFTKDEIIKYFSGTELIENKLTSKLSFSDGDYHDVVWKGTTLKGDPIHIQIKQAINLGNIDLTLEDKNEVVPELEYTATYSEDARDKNNWTIDFNPTTPPSTEGKMVKVDGK